MIEKPVPQDILKYKQKAFKNFSAREAIFGGIGLVIFGVTMLNFPYPEMTTNSKILLSVLPAMPFLLIGFIKFYDQPIEKILPSLLLDNFINPAKRKKEFHNKSMEEYENSRPWLLLIEDPKKKKKAAKKRCKKSETLKAYK